MRESTFSTLSHTWGGLSDFGTDCCVTVGIIVLKTRALRSPSSSLSSPGVSECRNFFWLSGENTVNELWGKGNKKCTFLPSLAPHFLKAIFLVWPREYMYMSDSLSRHSSSSLWKLRQDFKSLYQFTWQEFGPVLNSFSILFLIPYYTYIWWHEILEQIYLATSNVGDFKTFKIGVFWQLAFFGNFCNFFWNYLSFYHKHNKPCKIHISAILFKQLLYGKCTAILDFVVKHTYNYIM